MKKLSFFLCCVLMAVGSAFAGSTTDCPEKKCTGGWKTTGNNYGGEGLFKKYLYDDNTFAVYYGDNWNKYYSGSAHCAENTGTAATDTDAPTSLTGGITEPGQNCWCRLRGRNQNWVFVKSFDSKEACGTECAKSCIETQCSADNTDLVTNLRVALGICNRELADAEKCEGEGKKWIDGECKEEQKEEEKCKYTFQAEIKCKNGTEDIYKKTLEIPKDKFKDGKCTDETVDFVTWLRDAEQEVRDYVKEKCPDAYSGVFGEDEFTKAIKTMDAFFKASDGKASSWKDKEGNINAKRLASDLTAGVVLGTVGGVVSGVVIKKKQVEKGFEALHCAIGGQTVADWGDTFNVGLR